MCKMDGIDDPSIAWGYVDEFGLLLTALDWGVPWPEFKLYSHSDQIAMAAACQAKRMMAKADEVYMAERRK